MPRGYPDYGIPIATAYPWQTGVPHYASAEPVAAVGAGATVTVVICAIPVTHNCFLHTCICSARGTDTMHRFDVMVNAIVQKKYYFGDYLALPQACHVMANAGQTISIKFYNYDAAARWMMWSGIGVLLPIGTEPLKPDYSDKPKPKIKKGESLWLVENGIDGRKWVIAKIEEAK